MEQNACGRVCPSVFHTLPSWTVRIFPGQFAGLRILDASGIDPPIGQPLINTASQAECSVRLRLNRPSRQGFSARAMKRPLTAILALAYTPLAFPPAFRRSPNARRSTQGYPARREYRPTAPLR